MEKFKKLLGKAVQATGGKENTFAIICMIFIAVALLVVIALYPIKMMAAIVVVVVVVDVIATALTPPQLTLEQILEAVEYCLDDACNSLKSSLSVFSDLKIDALPLADESGVRLFPRWEWKALMMGGVQVVRIRLLKLSKTAIPVDQLHQERRVIQTLIEDDLNRALVPWISTMRYRDGTATLNLVNIFEDGSHICFDFVCVQDDKTAEFVHCYGLPPTGGNADDQDF